MSHQWTYKFADLVTNTLLGDVPLSGVNFTEQLKPPGSCTATLKLSDPKVQASIRGLGGGVGGLLQTGRTSLYVDFDGTLVWGGILWTVPDYDSTTQDIQLGFMDFWSYFSQRLITWDTSVYTNVDQFTIVENLVNTAQLVEGGSIGLIVPTTTCGVTFTVKWDQSQLVTVAAAVDTVASQAGNLGFDYGVALDYDGAGLPRKTLTLSYPRKGVLAGTPGWPQIDPGGKGSLGYKVARDSTQQAVSAWGVGSGSGPGGPGVSLLVAQEYRPQLSQGWPLLEQVLSRSDITDPATLYGVTRSFLAARAYPPEIITATLNIDSPLTPYGSYQVGDDARLLIEPDPFFTAGKDETQRITAISVTPGDEGVGTVAVTLQAPPIEGGGAAPPVRTYPRSIPAGVSLAHSYSSTTDGYNLAALNAHWFPAVSRATTGGAYARLNWVGDSITYGAFNTPPWTMSPPGQLRTKLTAVYFDGGTGMQMFYGPGVSAPDTRLAIGGFVDGTHGPAATSIISNTLPADFYLTPGTPFDNYTIWFYGFPGGGTFTYELIDPAGGLYYPVITVNTNLGAGYYYLTNTNPDTSPLATVFVNVVSGACEFSAWEASQGPSGVRVGRLAEPGMTAHTIATTSLSPTFGMAGGAAADLNVIQIGINDYAVQSLTFQADLTSMVTAAQASGGDVLLVVTQPNYDLLTKPQSDYSKAIYAVADAKNCAVLDLYDREGWYPNDISDPSFYADGIIHPTNHGAQDIANAVYAVVT